MPLALRSFVLTCVLVTSTAVTAAAEKRVFVQVGEGTVARGCDGRELGRGLRDATIKAFARNAKWVVTAPARRGRPTQAFYVEPEIVAIEQSGDELRCTVSLMLSSRRRINPFAVARGTAVVTNPHRTSSRDCVDVAVDSLIATEVVPALRNRAR